jgi:uncharacterized protein YbjT (DUF2867 family)
MPQKIVILGGTGFVGRALAARLAADGHRVTVLSRNRVRRREVGVIPNVHVTTCDVYSEAALTRMLANAEVAINLVGILNEPGRGGDGFVRAHVELTRKLVAACKAAGVPRLLQMSALNAGRGRSHYLRTRGEAEEVVRQSDLRWTIFEPSVIFGPGDGVFLRFAQLLKLSPVLPLARPKAKFAPVYLGDVVEAFVRALHDKSSIGQTYELYGPDTMTLEQIVKYTARHLRLKRVIVPLPEAAGRLQALALDFVPGKPFSTDNYLSLLMDSVGGIDGLYRLGIPRTPVDAVMPALLGPGGRQGRLDRYRRARAPR